MKPGDYIRLQHYMFGAKTDCKDYEVVEFRNSLGIFLSENDKIAQKFTPLCELYEPAPDSTKKYISNYGNYHTSYVPIYMQITSKNLKTGEQNDKRKTIKTNTRSRR